MVNETLLKKILRLLCTTKMLDHYYLLATHSSSLTSPTTSCTSASSKTYRLYADQHSLPLSFPSSLGFYSVSGSSLSDSCYSVSSEAALGLPGPPQAKPPRHGEQTSVPGDPSDPRWAEGMGHQQPVEQSIPEDTDGMGREVVSGEPLPCYGSTTSETGGLDVIYFSHCGL